MKTTKAKVNGTATAKKTEVPANGQAQQTKLSVVKNEEKAVSEAGQKAELRKQVKGLNLESTIKVVEELHRRKVHRDNLLATIERLEKFEIAHREDMDLEGDNQYGGCRLTIIDDERNEFSTKNPGLIKAISEYVAKMCTERLAEIEAGITLPA